jgi:metal-responsive CopG/Arc/MetJ family transcriptional regulator
MRTVQISLDEDLVRTADRVARDLHTTRSALAREALRQAIARIKIQKLEAKHRQGYLRQPEGADEFIPVPGSSLPLAP